MRQVLIINQKIEEAEEIAHNLGETKAEKPLAFHQSTKHCVSLIECVVVESKEEIKVIFIGGLETTERLRTDCAE